MGIEPANRFTSVNIDPKTDAAAKHAEVMKMQNGYWLAHRLLNSKARVVYGDACELARLVEPVDVVLIGRMRACPRPSRCNRAGL